MALTEQEAIDLIDTEVESISALEEINRNTSSISVWANLKKVMAFFIVTLQEYADNILAEVRSISDRQIVGTVDWTTEKIKEFRWKDQTSVTNPADRISFRLQSNNFSPGYNELALQETPLLEKVAVVDDASKPGELAVKVLKPANQVLSDAETTALNDYLGQIGFAGILYTVTSTPPEVLNIAMTVEIHDDVTPSDCVALVKNRIVEYLKEFPFNGVYYKGQLEKEILDLPGVLNICKSTYKVTPDQGVQKEIYETDQICEYKPESGLMTFDDDSAIVCENVST